MRTGCQLVACAADHCGRAVCRKRLCIN